MFSRKSNRLANYDYSKPGFYFITTCVQGRVCCLGDVENGKMVLNHVGKIVEQQWLWLKQQYPNVDLDEHAVMPNHFHGILIIKPKIDDGNHSLRKAFRLSNLISAFKTTSSKLIHESALNDFIWQKSFYDHVIRKDDSLDRIREYIRNNPAKWDLDRNNPANLWM